MHPPGYDTCIPANDPTAFKLSALISVGVLVSYLPQMFRIVYNKTSEGIDPLFLLLGSTSSASSFLNIVALSWSAVRCCSFLSGSSCLEGLMGIIQVGLQWACFNVIFLLFLAYYPPSAKWVSWVPGSVPQTKPSKLWRNIAKAFRPANYGGHEEVLTPNSEDSFDFRNATYSTMSSVRPGEQQVQTAASPEWRTSVNFAVLTGLHVAVCGFVTFLLLLLLPKASQPPVHPTPNPLPGPHQESHDARVVRLWATFLGVLSTLLAMCQYLPQIRRTWQRKLVGSLSIPMMCIQTPGAFVLVYSLLIRPGINWTAWGVYLVSGILQACLLIMCIAWTARQKRLGIDAYGQSITDGEASNGTERQPLLRS